ncbi:MAG TPA: preprotein translocase subunit SecG [Woeseiaceae bacterium]|nr:preprotein translocase subunit SecG [Woeseiaceae bacterium]
METVILMVHTLIALLIIVLVLLQRGKGADAGAAFGSGASGTVFGARGSANFFSRATAVLATAFFVSSLALAYLSSQDADRPDSLLESMPAAATEETPGPAPAEADEAPSMPALPETDEPPQAGEGEAADLPALEPAQQSEQPAEEPPGDDEQP